MQFGYLSNTIHSFFSSFTQSGQDEDGMIIKKEVVGLHQHQQQSDIFKDDSGVIKVTDTFKRVNDDNDNNEEINASRKRLKVSMSEKEKQRLMTFTRHSRREKVKEMHCKTISFVKVKQLVPPKIRTINANANGFDFGIASNLDEKVPIFGLQNKIDHISSSNRFPMNRKSFMPFVRPFSTPSNGFIGYRNYQTRPRNVNNGFRQFNDTYQRERPRHPFQPLVIMTTEDLIDEFLRDADPYQWSFPLPCHIEAKCKPNEKQFELCSSSSTVLESSHDEEMEEGQLDI